MLRIDEYTREHLQHLLPRAQAGRGLGSFAIWPSACREKATWFCLDIAGFGSHWQGVNTGDLFSESFECVIPQLRQQSHWLPHSGSDSELPSCSAKTLPTFTPWGVARSRVSTLPGSL
jgi:hypothetical protein